MAPLFELGSTNTQQISKFYRNNVILQEALAGFYGGILSGNIQPF